MLQGQSDILMGNVSEPHNPNNWKFNNLGLLLYIGGEPTSAKGDNSKGCTFGTQYKSDDFILEVVIPNWHEILALLNARNKLAIAVVNTSRNSGVSGIVSKLNTSLPPMLQSKECEYCYQAAECMIYHASVENGNAQSSGVPKLYNYIMQSNSGKLEEGNLSYVHMAYLRHFLNLLDIEDNATSGTMSYSSMHEKHRFAHLWSKLSAEREMSGESCIGNLKLKDFPSNAACNVSQSGVLNTIVLMGSFKNLRQATDSLVRTSLEANIAVGDRVFVSIEKLRQESSDDLEDLCGRVDNISSNRKSVGDLIFNQLSNVCSGCIISIVPCGADLNNSGQFAYHVAIEKGFDVFESIVKQLKCGYTVGVQQQVMYPKSNLAAKTFVDRLAFRLDKDSSMSTMPILRYMSNMNYC